MSTDFANYYMKKDIEYKKAALTANESTKKSLLPKQKHLQKYLRNLWISPSRKNAKEAQYLFYEGDFQQRLDEKHHLIGFTNGVFDLTVNLEMVNQMIIFL